jgi:hypothetical protein
MYRYRTYRSYQGTAASVVTTVGGIFAVIEAIYILMQVFDANPGNRFFTFIKSMAEPLALFFPGLFGITDHNLNVIVNYGLAALFWLVVTGFIARLVARL